MNNNRSFEEEIVLFYNKGHIRVEDNPTSFPGPRPWLRNQREGLG